MDKTTFEKITGYIRDVCGITLGADKDYLVNQRLSPVIEKFGFQGFEELALRMNTTFDTHLREQVIIAITTNETSFFRDTHPYQLLEERLIPELIELIRERNQRPFSRRGSKVSIWSAACSTGQEPYSIAIKIHEYLANNYVADVDCGEFGILATDISSKVVAKAVKGCYSENDLKRGLAQSDIIRHFVHDGSEWEVRESLRKIIDFKTLNLMEPFSHLGSFDLIFCRNVLIYFDDATKLKIVNQIWEMLNVGGYLVLGAAETLFGLQNRFEHLVHNDSHFFRKI